MPFVWAKRVNSFRFIGTFLKPGTTRILTQILFAMFDPHFGPDFDPILTFQGDLLTPAMKVAR